MPLIVLFQLQLQVDLTLDIEKAQMIKLHHHPFNDFSVPFSSPSNFAVFGSSQRSLLMY